MTKKDGLFGRFTRGSPLGIGQPRADFLNTVGVVVMPRYARGMDEGIRRPEDEDENEEEGRGKGIDFCGSAGRLAAAQNHVKRNY